MTGLGHPGEKQEKVLAAANGHTGSSNLARRAFAMVLLLLATPMLLFFGGGGVLAFTTLFPTNFGPIMLGIFAALSVVSYKGVKNLWRGDGSGIGWILAMVFLAFVSCIISIWIFTWWDKPLPLHT